jgi:hypothetical protein
MKFGRKRFAINLEQTMTAKCQMQQNKFLGIGRKEQYHASFIALSRRSVEKTAKGNTKKASGF